MTNFRTVSNPFSLADKNACRRKVNYFGKLMHWLLREGRPATKQGVMRNYDYVFARNLIKGLNQREYCRHFP